MLLLQLQLSCWVSAPSARLAARQQGSWVASMRPSAVSAAFWRETLQELGLGGAVLAALLPWLCAAGCEDAHGASGRAAAVLPVGVLRGLEGRESCFTRWFSCCRASGLSL